MTNPDNNSHPAAQFQKEKLCGLFLPITTPFASDGELGLPALRSNIGKWNQTGIAGYVVLGSTGERVHLDEHEYLQVIKTAREEVSPERTFIAGVGQQSTLGTVKEINRVASSVTTDAVLVLTPSFYRPSISQSALIKHYETVADESPVPVILYSMPPLTGITIEPETVARLSRHQNIVGIKDSSADVAGFRNTVTQVDKDFAVLTGNGTVLADTMMAGACGAVLAVACVAPDLCSEIIRAVSDGQHRSCEGLTIGAITFSRGGDYAFWNRRTQSGFGDDWFRGRNGTSAIKSAR